jgi:antitoxin component YwqK of YwqJK toxin-antitoxin module
MRQIKNIYIFISLIISLTYTSAQNLDYNKYESSKNLDLSYKIYLDNRNSNSQKPETAILNRENRSISCCNFENKYFDADKGEGNFAFLEKNGELGLILSANVLAIGQNNYKKKNGEAALFLVGYHLDFGIGHFVSRCKTGEWDYYFNGKIKEKANYYLGERQGATYYYDDEGKVSDTLYFYNDYLDGMLNLDKMNNYMEYLRYENVYAKYSSKFLNGEWVETQFPDNSVYVGKKNRDNRRIGIWKVYTIKGNEKKLQQIISYNNGVRQGKCIAYYSSGEVNYLANFDNGVVNGEVQYYYPNGKIKRIVKNNDSVKLESISISEDGEVFFGRGSEPKTKRIKVTDPAILLRIKKFKNPNTIADLKSINNEDIKNSITANKSNDSEDDNIYNTAGLDKYPSFIGETGDVNAYVNQNFNTKKLSGKVFISFVIEKDGNLSSMKVLRDLGEGSGDEVIRILNLCKNCWSPAEIKGKKVRCFYSLPITINN